MVLGVIKKAFGDYNEKELKKLWPLVEVVAGWEDEIAGLSDDELREKTAEFRERLSDGETLDDALSALYGVSYRDLAAAWAGSLGGESVP